MTPFPCTIGPSGLSLFYDPQLATYFRHWCAALRLPHCVQHLLGCEVLPHPASLPSKEPLHEAGNTNILWSSFSGMCHQLYRMGA